jgi:coenzyme F420-reducing hydrogenase alpha subunit
MCLRFRIYKYKSLSQVSFISIVKVVQQYDKNAKKAIFLRSFAQNAESAIGSAKIQNRF